ncbi:hypothetical protein [Salipiger mucosus]|uniref:Uncharacterized protein n=1 Tax=Salipiger mucosus DSM 16094 TaxID=1123237 RepID=S9QAU0_9RHOB|nr:hypothetical protein [Salipiger mucosus]EPX76758.1 hypothetical protein Salmuc_04644 [Salipiger mucosus DSM 16094]
MDGHESGDYNEIDTFIVDPAYLSETLSPAEGGHYQAILDAYAAQADAGQGFQEFLMSKLEACMEAGFELEADPAPKVG